MPHLMLSPTLVSSPPSGIFLRFSLKPCPIFLARRDLRWKKNARTVCRAELLGDAPLVVAIGACMVTSLLLPIDEADEETTGIDSTDTRIAVMGIISFIPYFNWLSWVFAWLDTKRRRYAIYALVYLAPYLRSNFSLSPEESWLPITSVLLGIMHVQLEASIKNGDFQPLIKSSNFFSSEDDTLQREKPPKRFPKPESRRKPSQPRDSNSKNDTSNN